METSIKGLWEILIPTVRNDGHTFPISYHRAWDGKVRAISGGLTIMPVAKGQWIDMDCVFEDRMIPVRIIATREEIDAIIEMTMTYYQQLALLAYRISDEVILRKA